MLWFLYITCSVLEWTNEEESTRKKSKWLLVAYRISESNPHVFKFSAQIRHLYHKVYTYVWGICICLHRCAFLFCDCMYGLCKCVYVQARFWCQFLPWSLSILLLKQCLSLNQGLVYLNTLVGQRVLELACLPPGSAGASDSCQCTLISPRYWLSEPKFSCLRSMHYSDWAMLIREL